jgi:hypothetical protein
MAIPGNIGSKKSSSNPFGMAASKGSMPTPGISAASPATRKEITRQQFFKGRPDVSDDRLVRRQTQADELRAFKQGLTIAPGTTNLYQEQAPVFNPMTGRYERTTLADKAQELAFKYGPTPREVLGDIGYGIRSIGSALGQKVAAGEFGFMGLAKSLYEQFTNSAAKAKDALVKGVNKLSDIDLEVLKKKDTGEYKFLSKKAEIQEVENLEKTQMTAFDQANLIRANMERVSTPLTEADTAQSFKVQPEDQVNLQDIYMQGTKRYEPISVSGTQPMYAGGLESLLPQPIQNLQQRVSSLGETPIGTFGMENIRSGKPAFTYEKDIFGGQLGVKADPFRDQYGFEFSRAFKDGGSVDDKLDNMQKKTNNIYGTGILSVR